MTKQNPAPPPLPGQAAAKVAALSRANSLAVAGFAALSLVAAAIARDPAAAGWCTAALAAGLLEWQGQRTFRTGRRAGLAGMVASQLILLATIWSYAWLRWRNFDAEALWSQFPAFAQRLLEQRMIAGGLDPVLDRPLLMEVTNLLVCASLALVALLYQGGLAAYYLLRGRPPRPPGAKTPSTPLAAQR